MTPGSPPFTVAVAETASGARLLILSGPLTIKTLFDFQAAVRAEIGKPLIVDLSAVPYMDSAGLGSVMSAYTAWQRLQRGFALCGVCDRVRTLLAITHVDDILPCFGSIPDAEAGIAASGTNTQ